MSSTWIMFAIVIFINVDVENVEFVEIALKAK
jgi:hypothetical protein